MIFPPWFIAAVFLFLILCVVYLELG